MYFKLPTLLYFIFFSCFMGQAQNGTYMAMGIAPTHSFNRNYQPFTIPKINYEPSIELGFTRGKMSYFGKYLFSHSLSKNMEQTNGNPTDYWYSITKKEYGLFNTSGILGIKLGVYSTPTIKISIPLALTITRSVYDESRSITNFPNQPSIHYPAHDGSSSIKYNFQLNTGIESNINLLKETIFLHTQLIYYVPPFNSQALWHRVSLNLGLKFQLNQSVLKKYIQEYNP